MRKRRKGGGFKILKVAGVDFIGLADINKNWGNPFVKR